MTPRTLHPAHDEAAHPIEHDAARPLTWEVARLFPRQGEWTAPDYYVLQDRGRIELIEGRLEVLPMAVNLHQIVLRFLFRLLEHALPEDQYTVWQNGLTVHVEPGDFLLPDVVVIALPEDDIPIGRAVHSSHVPLVIEVVSESNRDNDVLVKRRVYARGRIREYWIVDPDRLRIERLNLRAGADAYDATSFGPGDHAASLVMPPFAFEVDDVFRRVPRDNVQ